MDKATFTIEYPCDVDKITYTRHMFERVIEHALFSGISRNDVMLLLKFEYDLLDYPDEE